MVNRVSNYLVIMSRRIVRHQKDEIIGENSLEMLPDHLEI